MPRPSFAPTPLGSDPAIAKPDYQQRLDRSTATTYQPTLFELRFGPSRNRKPALKDRTLSGQPAEPPQKRIKVETTHGNETATSSGVSDQPEAHSPTAAVGPLRGHLGPFHPVTKASFCDEHRVEGLPDAEIFYNARWIDTKTAERWRRELDRLSEWYQPKLKVYGREITQSRDIAAFATDPGLPLKYSGHDVEMHHPFPPLLDHIASLLCSDACLGSEVRFNHCMLNRYEDGKVYIGRHADNLENKVICTVSLGAERSWIMERRAVRRKKGEATISEEGGERIKERWTLSSGSLLVMQGDTQKYYTHEIPKELKVKQPRISITFRQLVYQ